MCFPSLLTFKVYLKEKKIRVDGKTLLENLLQYIAGDMTHYMNDPN